MGVAWALLTVISMATILLPEGNTYMHHEMEMSAGGRQTSKTVEEHSATLNVAFLQAVDKRKTIRDV